MDKKFCDICGKELKSTHLFRINLEFYSNWMEILDKYNFWDSKFELCPRCAIRAVKYLKKEGKKWNK